MQSFSPLRHHCSFQSKNSVLCVQWEEVEEKREQLVAEQALSDALEANRRRFLEHEMQDAVDLAVKLQEEDGYFGEHFGSPSCSRSQVGTLR